MLKTDVSKEIWSVEENDTFAVKFMLEISLQLNLFFLNYCMQWWC